MADVEQPYDGPRVRYVCINSLTKLLKIICLKGQNNTKRNKRFLHSFLCSSIGKTKARRRSIAKELSAEITLSPSLNSIYRINCTITNDPQVNCRLLLIFHVSKR